MKERPIIFNAEMVKAILEGRKTQARRVMKPQPDKRVNHFGVARGFGFKEPLWLGLEGEGMDSLIMGDWVKSPYGNVGDRLWVRETYHIDSPAISMPIEKETAIINYKADSSNEDLRCCNLKWKPSIFMPRWASRISLEITDIRVERVQEISEGDAEKEGLKLLQGGIRVEFENLWNSIHKKQNCWEDNPFVWCISFKLLTP